MSIPSEILKGKVSPLRQLYHLWKSKRNVPFRKKFFVGYDLDGNTFWEFQNYNDPKRMRRIVDYQQKRLNYVDYKLSPQWMQWLRFNRPSHPTLDELIQDQKRQMELKGLVKMANERWKSVPLKASATDQSQAKPHVSTHPSVGSTIPSTDPSKANQFEPEG